MSLSDLASLGSFISDVAVLASLVYLSIQIRQNSKHSKALISQNRVDRVTSTLLTLASSDLSTAYSAANGEGATESQVRQRQFDFICTALLNGWHDTFIQHQTGLLDQEQFVRFRNGIGATFMRDPAVRRFLDAWLVRQRPAGAVEATSFLAFVEGLLKDSNSIVTRSVPSLVD
jgi:hypothetical protein